MRRLLFSLLALGACAQAGKIDLQGRPDGGHNDPIDGGQTLVDAFVSHVDAPPGMMTKTLDENASDTIQLNSSIACTNQTDGTTVANSYYRLFDPGTTTDFHITQVGFQVEDCQGSAGNGQIVTVKVGTYNGSLGAAQLALTDLTTVATNANVQIPEINMNGGSVNAPIDATIPAGQKMFVEIDSPKNGSTMYIGVNAAAETEPGYILATDCGVTVPKNYATAIGATLHLLITATGTY